MFDNQPNPTTVTCASVRVGDRRPVAERAFPKARQPARRTGPRVTVSSEGSTTTALRGRSAILRFGRERPSRAAPCCFDPEQPGDRETGPDFSAPYRAVNSRPKHPRSGGLARAGAYCGERRERAPGNVRSGLIERVAASMTGLRSSSSMVRPVTASRPWTGKERIKEVCGTSSDVDPVSGVDGPPCPAVPGAPSVRLRASSRPRRLTR
jgi:hypothetical protein